MPSSRIPSPARSQGARSTPRRYKPRASRSVCSPARSTTSVKLSAVVMSQMNFELSPLPTRRSVLADTTEIDAPRRHSWWKKLNENSNEIMETLHNKETAEVNEVEELIEVVVPSQEKENCTLDLPDSSDNESIRSIVIQQRMLFTQKDNQQHNKFAQIIDTRKSLTKLQKSHVVDDNDLNVGPKNLFNHGTRPKNKPVFPSDLLNISVNKTLTNKTKELNANDVKGQVKSLFGSRQGTKRKNMFLDFIVSESDDEIPEIQPKVFVFQKATEQPHKPIFNHRNRRESSPSSITDIEIDEWRLLPSSTMVDHQLEDALRTTPSKRIILSKLSEGTESTTNKTKLSNKSIINKHESKNLSNLKEIEVNKVIVPSDDYELDGGMDDPNDRTRKSLRKTNTSITNISHERSSRAQNRSLKKSKKDHSKSTDNTTTNHEQDKANHTKGHELQNEKISHKIDTYNQEICDNQNNSGCNNADNNIEINQYKEQNSHKLIDVNRDDEMQHNGTLKRRSNIDEDDENRQITDKNKGVIVDEHIQIDENGLMLENNDHNDVQESKEETQDGSEKSDEDIRLRMEDEEEMQQESHIENKIADEKEETNINDTDANDTQVVDDEGKTDNSIVNGGQENVNGEEENQVRSDTEDQKANAENNNHDEYNDEQEMQRETDKESEQNIDHDTDITDNEEEVSVENEARSEPESDELEDSNDRYVSEESDNDEEMQEDQNDKGDNNDRSNASHEIGDDNNESDIEDDAQTAHDNKGEEDMEETHTDHENVSLKEEPDSAEEIDDDDENREEMQSSQENVSQEVEPESASEIEHDNDNDDEVITQEDNEQNESQDEVDNDSEAEDHYQFEGDEIGEIKESSKINEQDTTGRHRKKQSEVLSPEAVLQNKMNQQDSFTVQERNTSVRKTKSIIKALNIRPSLAPRESTDFSDGTRDSSAGGSGWDSHRTTRLTLRKTFGKDFTPRKSLRALVMEKSAKRQTMANFAETNAEISKFPQANSTELPAEEPIDTQDDIDVQESDHEESRRQRQTTLELYLQKVKRENMERRKQLQEEVKNSLNAPKKDVFNFFKVPAVPKRRAPLQTKPKAKPKTSSVFPIDMLPPQLLLDMKYKPPKRYQPASASWITKRLYSFLETKLEPKYNYKARVRSEKLVQMIYEFTKTVRRHNIAPADAVNELKHEMARLQIVKTHFEFYEFFHEYMPREVRVKVVPDAFNNVPLPKHGVFSDILQ